MPLPFPPPRSGATWLSGKRLLRDVKCRHGSLTSSSLWSPLTKHCSISYMPCDSLTTKPTLDVSRPRDAMSVHTNTSAWPAFWNDRKMPARTAAGISPWRRACRTPISSSEYPSQLTVADLLQNTNVATPPPPFF
ncbi:hypothetical protein EYF80_022995 [Liparis tanakae]|uniref:Uncharacterized protein n=1 Tax=Liparis tanakae TaxID=230148 RepID=A0A4Z2HP37_9TELE|nr:hypothetical protein EYF80_022995 [Liparis tanakae]